MRPTMIIGALLILAGGIVIAGGVRYTQKHDVVDLGGIRISADEKKPIPTWVGGVAAIAGLALVFAGGKKR